MATAALEVLTALVDALDDPAVDDGDGFLICVVCRGYDGPGKPIIHAGDCAWAKARRYLGRDGGRWE